jgi:two-component system nitrate/nitrite response regulator NarL
VTESLSPRQTETLRLIAEGYRDREIAPVLGCAHRTVLRHVAAILERLEARTRSQAVYRAVTAGLI